MNRFVEYCSDLKDRNETAFVSYFTAGYPDLKSSIDYIKAAMKNGSDIIEVGVPFSDPVADGPTIAHAAQIALDAGFKINDLLVELKKIRDEGLNTPIVLFSYLNPLFKKGTDKLAKELKEIGVEAVLVVDCPYEEKDIYYDDFKNNSVAPVMLVSPTTSDNRMQAIVDCSEGFIYAISQVGVTGTRKELNSSASDELQNIRSKTSKPIYAGFGISNPEQAKKMAVDADGIIIGSALTKIIDSSKSHEEAVSSISKFVRSIKDAIT